MSRADRKSLVRNCLEFCTADFCTSLAWESAEKTQTLPNLRLSSGSHPVQLRIKCFIILVTTVLLSLLCEDGSRGHRCHPAAAVGEEGPVAEVQGAAQEGRVRRHPLAGLAFWQSCIRSLFLVIYRSKIKITSCDVDHYNIKIMSWDLDLFIVNLSSRSSKDHVQRSPV